MSRSRSFERAVASFLFVLYTAFTVLGGALVRCQEADGTVSIEWRSAGCCIPKVANGSAEPAAVAAAKSSPDDCGGCTDQALTETLTSMAARGSVAAAIKAPDVDPVPHIVFAAVPPTCSQCPERRVREMRAPHPPPELSKLRTVVLRV